MRVAVLDDDLGVARSLAEWDSLPAEVSFFSVHMSDHDEIVRALAGFDVLVVMRERTPFSRDLLRRLPALRLLVTTGTKNASLDLAAAADLGIVVCGTRQPYGPTTELTWAFILGLARHTVSNEQAIRGGGWQEHLAADLAGSTLGLLGLGSIGSRVARIAAAFEMNVVSWSPHLTNERAESSGTRLVSRSELFALSDFVSLHLVLSESTRHIVGREELGQMQEHAFLINTSRAQLVDQAALRGALESGIIAGAALDVFDIEPLPADHWIRTSPRTLLSPHTGYVSRVTYQTYFEDAVESIAGFLQGRLVRPLIPALDSDAPRNLGDARATRRGS